MSNMIKTAYHTIIAVGDTGHIYNLHEMVRRLLWEAGPDFVKLLSPVCHGLAIRLASFALVPHGLAGDSPEAMMARDLLGQAVTLIKEAGCHFVEVAFGPPPDAPAVLSHSE